MIFYETKRYLFFALEKCAYNTRAVNRMHSSFN